MSRYHVTRAIAVASLGAGGGAAAYQLLKQQGRILLRIDELERSMGGTNTVTALAEKASVGSTQFKLRGQRGLSESRLRRDGLAPGTPAPDFTLPDVHGRDVSLADFRGRRIVVAFSDPGCGPCAALVPALVRAYDAGDDGNLAVILVGRGRLDDNRRIAEDHGCMFLFVVQEGWNLSREYGIFETPVAFLVDEQGIVARRVARGFDEIIALLASPSVPTRAAAGG